MGRRRHDHVCVCTCVRVHACVHVRVSVQVRAGPRATARLHSDAPGEAAPACVCAHVCWLRMHVCVQTPRGAMLCHLLLCPRTHVHGLLCMPGCRAASGPTRVHVPWVPAADAVVGSVEKRSAGKGSMGKGSIGKGSVSQRRAPAGAPQPNGTGHSLPAPGSLRPNALTTPGCKANLARSPAAGGSRPSCTAASCHPRPWFERCRHRPHTSWVGAFRRWDTVREAAGGERAASAV